MTDTLGAPCWIDLIVQIAVEDSTVRAFGLADIAIDALLGDLQRHRGMLKRSLAGRRAWFADTILQHLVDMWVDEVTDIATERGDLAHQ